MGELARRFAGHWGAGDLAYLAGLWHDLGKYAADWQDFLRETGPEAPVLGQDSAETDEEPAHARGAWIEACLCDGKEGRGRARRGEKHRLDSPSACRYLCDGRMTESRVP